MTLFSLTAKAAAGATTREAAGAIKKEAAGALSKSIIRSATSRCRPSIQQARILSLVLLLSLACPPLSFAAEPSKNGTFFGHSADGKWIIGAKIANVDPNIAEVSDADGKGIVLGYEFARPVGDNGSSTVELEYITTDATPLSLFDPDTTYESDIVNLFFTYRTAGRVYFKVKAGLSYSDRTINNAPLGLLTDSGEVLFGGEEVALAAGLGFGLRINEYGVIEVEYSQDASDLDTGILGVNAFLQF